MKHIELYSNCSVDDCVQRLKGLIVSSYPELPFWNWGPKKVMGSLGPNGFEIWLKRRPPVKGKPLSIRGTYSPYSSGTLIHLEYEDPVNANSISYYTWGGGLDVGSGLLGFLGLWLTLFAASIELIKSLSMRVLTSAILSFLFIFISFYIWAHYEYRLIRFLMRRLDAYEKHKVP